MLERTSSALEQCSRMQLLPVLESSRRLQSGFWKHSGVLIELSPAWNALLRSQSTSRRQRASTTTLPGPVFLDFLYPNSGPSLLQSPSSVTSDARSHSTHEIKYRYPPTRHVPNQRLATLPPQARRRQSTVLFGRHSTRALSPRRFSTVTVDSLDMSTMPMMPPPIPQTIDPSDPWELVYRLKKMLATKGTKPSRVWGIYTQLPKSEQAEVKQQVMMFLSKFGSRQHISQVLSWIPDTSPTNIDSETFGIVLRCHLRIRRYTSALRYFESGIEAGHSQKVFEEAIAFAFQRRAWRLLIRIWSVWNTQRPSSLGHFQFERVRNLPRLDDLVVSLSNHAKEHTEFLEGMEVADRPDYAQAYMGVTTDDLIRRSTRWIIARGCKYNRALALLEALDRTPLFLSYIIHRLRQQQFEHVRELYAIYKAREDHVLDKELLNRMFEVFASTNDIGELRRLYRDFKRTHGQLDATMLQNFLQYYSARGDVGSIHRLWPSFIRAISAEPDSIEPAMFNPILTAFAVLGDVHKVKSLIHEMQQQYGIDMGAFGHQAILKAYVYANEYAGAVSAFQELCRHSAPDRQSLLTILSIAASYGDLSLVLSTHDALRKLGLKDDPEALKYLIEGYAKTTCWRSPAVYVMSVWPTRLPPPIY
jgi:tetratricopeptide (TPR) repeat protein